jgi:hypothetical protein
MLEWIIPGALLLAAAGKRGDTLDVPRVPVKVDQLRALLADAGAPPDWQRVMPAIAARESNFSPSARNTSQGEAKAAKIAYERNREKFAQCGFPESRYTFGSGGLWGLLPASALAGLPPCTDPLEAVFDPILSTRAALAYAQRLQRWGSYRVAPSWAQISRGWAAPTLMDGTPAVLVARIDRDWRKHLQRIGLPASTADERPSEL